MKKGERERERERESEREREGVQKLSQIDIPTFNRCNIRLKKNILKMDPKFFLLRSFDE